MSASNWDEAGTPIEFQICSPDELDYKILPNELATNLKEYLRMWVRVRGIVFKDTGGPSIKIEEIITNQFKAGGTK